MLSLTFQKNIIPENSQGVREVHIMAPGLLTEYMHFNFDFKKCLPAGPICPCNDI